MLERTGRRLATRVNFGSLGSLQRNLPSIYNYILVDIAQSLELYNYNSQKYCE